MIEGFCLKVVARGYVPGANGWNTHGFRLFVSKVYDTHAPFEPTGEELWQIRPPTNPTGGVPLFNLDLTSGALTRNSPDPMHDGSQVYIPFPFDCWTFEKRIYTAPPAVVPSRGAAANVTVPSGVYESGSLLRWDTFVDLDACGANSPASTRTYGEFSNRARWGVHPDTWTNVVEIDQRSPVNWDPTDPGPNGYIYDWGMYFGDDCFVPGAEFV
jgi:hypothetical protein